MSLFGKDEDDFVFVCPECSAKQVIEFDDLEDKKTKMFYECLACEVYFLVEIELSATFRIFEVGDEYDLGD